MVKIFSFLFVFFSIAVLILYLYAYFSPKIIIQKANKYYIYDKDGNLIHQGSSSSKWVKLDDVSKYYIDAVISVEDKNFYKHSGFDYPRIIKAMLKNVSKKRIVEGASTISQQYIKNLYQNFDKTWSRKWKETLLTLNLEAHYSKDEILEGYINTINFGQGNIGIYNASKFYFNKEPSELSIEESLILAAIPKSPENYNPVSNYDEAIKRAKIVLSSVLNNKLLKGVNHKEIFKEKIEIYGKNDQENLNTLMYYQDAVLNELKNKIQIPDEIIKKKGIKIYTNLDVDLQRNLEQSVYNYMGNETMQVSSVIIDPSTGGVRALTGGLDYSKSQYNRALKSKGQVGSTIKSFLYYTALENSLTSASTFLSEPVTFTLENSKPYTPINYGKKYAMRDITMASAIALSDNIYAVKTNLFLGGSKLINTMKKIGIKENLRDIPSLPLGTIEINMLDYAQGYQVLANMGVYNKVHFINKIEDSSGNVLYEFDEDEDQVLNPDYVYILNEMLSNTTNPKFIDYTNPTALVIKDKLQEKYAIKTGTTKTDFWTIGYNKNNLMLVWAGNDDGSEVSSSKSFYTKNIFADTIKHASKDVIESWYETPENIIGIPLDPTTGKVSKKNNSIFYFVKGSEKILEEKE